MLQGKNSVEKKKTKKNYDILFKVNKRGQHVSCIINVLRCIIIPIYYILKPFQYFGNKKYTY